ncbi:Copper amine oxidase [Macrophomina phaseolina MS6]|uniref:Amine oxidase n=1 Tax=Macrophomina phaseolina (strain MS6) TaxID=1126212 RepID=K2QJH1_MACPH|nr:Copper amine oxidase [Macrophomina phaseolina MS6]
MTDKRISPLQVQIPSVVGLLCLLGIILIFTVPNDGRFGRILAIRSTDKTIRFKPLPSPIYATKKNVWQDLSEDDVHNVTQWLLAQRDLNLTNPETAGPWSNSILFVELNIPNKTEVLPYIDNDTSEAVPTRYARVVTTLRATLEASWQELLVGPLPISDETTVEPLQYLLTRKTNGRVRWLDPDAHGALEDEFLYKVSASVADITLDLCGGVAIGQDNDTLDLIGLTTPYQKDTAGRIIRWDEFKRRPTDKFDAQTLLPQGLFLKTDVTGRDPSKWRVLGWFYNNKFYAGTREFRAAYESPDFQRLKPNVEGDWARTDRQGPAWQHDLLRPPTMLHPNGKARFSIDNAERYVEWMDFSFFIGFSHDTGMSLYDIRYRGERVLYELGLQEILVHYAGSGPYESGHVSHDSHVGIGRYAFQLVPGYDCPSYATFLDTRSHSGGRTNLRRNTICIFEYMSDSPIQRHTAFTYLSITSNVYLTVRTVSTIADYDYVISYKFYTDGSIGVEAEASGYIIAAHRAHNHDYGYSIHDHLSGSMHEHIINFKADFDVLGTQNTVQMVRNVPTTQVYPWSNGKARSTMRLERSFITNEDQGRWNWDDSTAQKQLVVVNQDAINAYGEMRGYQLVPGQPAAATHARLTAINSTSLGRTAGWSSHDVHITAQHDTEPRSAYPFNAHDLYDPPIDFDRFFNGEDLNQTDLVIWFNLGMYHLPHTGDLPNTLTTTAHAGVKLVPVNFFSLDQSRRTVNQVRIDYDEGKVTHVEIFGREMNSSVPDGDVGCCWLNDQAALAELYGYDGPA